MLKNLLMAALATLALFGANSAAASKSAAELSDLCLSEAPENRYRCLGYIQGYIEGARIAGQTPAQIAEEDSDSSWARRAIDTRIGTKLRVRYDQAAEPLCLGAENSAARVKEMILAEPRFDEVNASNWLRSLVSEEFGCRQQS
jgi:hypothetical protein